MRRVTSSNSASQPGVHLDLVLPRARPGSPLYRRRRKAFCVSDVLDLSKGIFWAVWRLYLVGGKSV